MAEAVEAARGGKRRRGVVVSKSGAKTIVVQVERRVRHPLYGKVVRQMRKFHAHDERDTAKVGDVVRIAECRPMSRMKRWRLLEVVGVARKEAIGVGEE
jgi:small subunit ribosomal protein S17